jgi:uncharacterized protein with HEPN domain
MPRDFRLALRDIVERAKLIDDALRDKTYEEFLAEPHLRAAIERYIEVIGEAVKLVPDELKGNRDDWRLAAKMRNILAHEYFGIVPKITWDTATADVPRLRQTVEKLLSDEQG